MPNLGEQTRYIMGNVQMANENKKSFSNQWLCTWPCFEKEVWGNFAEMVFSLEIMEMEISFPWASDFCVRI